MVLIILARDTQKITDNDGLPSQVFSEKFRLGVIGFHSADRKTYLYSAWAFSKKIVKNSSQKLKQTTSPCSNKSYGTEVYFFVVQPFNMVL